jgi:hypothetical protein
LGVGGGDQLRCLMSQRAVPAMIMQPMLPLGDLNVATWTVLGGATVVVAVVEDAVEDAVPLVGVEDTVVNGAVGVDDEAVAVAVTVVV